MIALSSAESEYYACATVVAEAIHIARLLAFVGLVLPIRARLDSTAARAMSSRVGVGKVRHMEAKTLWLQGKVASKVFEVFKF